MENGYLNGEVCNRDGCNGIIDEHDSDGGCSCHINPPCSHCTDSREFCPVCGWDGEEEQKLHEQNSRVTYTGLTFKLPKRRTVDDLDNTKVDWFISKTWHSGQELRGVYPENYTVNEVAEKLKEGGVRFDKCTMGRFKVFRDGKFTYSYFTD